MVSADGSGVVGAGAERSGRASVPLWATPAVTALIVLLLTTPRLIFAARHGLIGDETYYALWSLYPGFGYYDHSPAVAWVIWLGRALFGEGQWPVRSLFVLATFPICAALYRTARLLGGEARVGAIAAISYAVTPAVAISTTIATPDAPSTLFWVLAVWAIAEFVRGRNPNWWLAAGLFAGLGLLSKYTVVFLGAGILLYLVSSRERLPWLRLWQVWAGGALALALFAPVVWIDWTRNWQSFRFQLGRSPVGERALHLDELLRFFVEIGVQLLPTLFVFAVLGIALFIGRRAKPLALPLLTAAPMLCYFIVHGMFGRVNPNWIAPIYPPLALAGAWAAVHVRPDARWLRWPLDALKLLHVPAGVLLLVTALGAVEFRALPGVGPVPLFGFFYGWDNLQAKISRLAAENGAEWVDAQDYSLTGWLSYYGTMAGDPLPVRNPGNAYRYKFMPPVTEEMQAAPHLVVRYTRGNRVPKLEGATPLGIVTRDDADGTPLQPFAVYLRDE
ncbi:MAG TPA: glycosyltransferase family 39 protein [Devosia sp.]|jgi:4-amino-4-deoxy-L-arabinose transferase-like glycosyltransferase|nr:glycosyltransferase family 39 protein [Devosia sp.]